MSDLICCTEIIAVGSSARDFHEENMLITFKDGISRELSDYCFILPKDLSLHNELLVNQKITIGDYSYIITAVGDIASKNFASLGHVTIFFDGNHQAKLDGAIHVEGKYPLKLNIGDRITINNNC